MNIVVVEDEQMTREGLIRIIQQNTTHSVIGWAEDGEKGEALIERLLPDLIITDIQTPNQNGLAMLEQLSNKGLEIPAVILTGYSDFEYARTALRLGVVEYLLKPVTVEDLNQCFLKLEQLVRREAGSMISVQELITLLLSCHDTEKKQELIQTLRLHLQVHERGRLAAVLVRPRAIDNESISALLNKLHEAMEMLCYEHSFVLRLPFDYGILILTAESEVNERFESSVEQNILPDIQEICVCTASSLRFERLEELEDCIYRMKEMLAYSLVLAPERLITPAAIDRLDLRNADYPSHVESKMKQAIYQKDKQRILEAADEFQKLMFARPVEPRSLVEKFLFFLSSAYAVLQECNPQMEDNNIYQNMVKEISEVANRQDFLDSFEEVVDWIANTNETAMESQNLIIVRVISYIRHHYHENISLTQMAEMNNVTPEYLSKLFNKEVKVTFSAFLKNFRISCAKRLIVTGKYKMHEVAEAVGFTDPKYFNRVFKEICGQSPSDFKKGN